MHELKSCGALHLYPASVLWPYRRFAAMPLVRSVWVDASLYLLVPFCNRNEKNKHKEKIEHTKDTKALR